MNTFRSEHHGITIGVESPGVEDSREPWFDAVYHGGELRAFVGGFVGNRPSNQDMSAFYIMKTAKGKEIPVAIVCDGHGSESEKLAASLAHVCLPMQLELVMNTHSFDELWEMTHEQWTAIGSLVFSQCQSAIVEDLVRKAETLVPLTHIVSGSLKQDKHSTGICRAQQSSRSRAEVECVLPDFLKPNDRPSIPFKGDKLQDPGSTCTVSIVLRKEGTKGDSLKIVSIFCGDSLACLLQSGDINTESGTSHVLPLFRMHTLDNPSEKKRLEHMLSLYRSKGEEHPVKIQNKRLGLEMLHLKRKMSIEPTRGIGHPLFMHFGVTWIPEVDITETIIPSHKDNGLTDQVVLLGSDGFWDTVGEDAYSFFSLENPREIALVLESRFRQVASMKKNMDNVTFVAMPLTSSSKTQ